MTVALEPFSDSELIFRCSQELWDFFRVLAALSRRKCSVRFNRMEHRQKDLQRRLVVCSVVDMIDELLKKKEKLDLRRKGRGELCPVGWMLRLAFEPRLIAEGTTLGQPELFEWMQREGRRQGATIVARRSEEIP